MSHYDIFFDRTEKKLSFVRSLCNEHEYADSVPHTDNDIQKAIGLADILGSITTG